MNGLKWNRLKLDTLFVRLLSYFFIMILLFVLVYYLSIVYSKRFVYGEIIAYNQLNMENTVENYENQLHLIKTSATGLYWEETFSQLYTKTASNEAFDYYLADSVRKRLRSYLLQSAFQYVENIFVVFQQVPAIIDSEGVYTKPKELEPFLINESYDHFFADDRTAPLAEYEVLPFSMFTRYTSQATASKRLIPLVIPNQFFQNMKLIVMVDADKMLADLHQSINNELLILDAGRRVIFAANPVVEGSFPELNGSDYFRQNDNYYFSGRGKSGLQYINKIPTEHVAAKIGGLNKLFLFILFVVISVSVSISIMFARQLNDPIKRMLNSLKPMNIPAPFTSKIKEFNDIRDNLKDLYNKNSLLRYYAYANQLKDIQSNFGKIQELLDTGRSFVLLVTEIAFKKAFRETLDLETSQAINGIREYIDIHFAKLFPGTLTFQIEKQQIITIVFTEGENKSIPEALQDIQSISDLERDYYYLTISCGKVRTDPKELREAYEEALAMLAQRELNDETQVIWRQDSGSSRHTLSTSQEMEFHNYLMTGNEKDLLQWVERQLNVIERKGNFALDYRQFARQATDRAEQALGAMLMDTGRLQLYHAQIEYCCTRRDYELLLNYFLTTAVEIVKQHKDRQDPIIVFVTGYLDNHYYTEVSLEAVAERLKLTSGYLSSYFKEKTGWNFSDYLNHLRIEKAKHLLEHTNLKIKEVAEQVGYYNVNSFIRMFKKMSGLTPGDFRKTSVYAED